MEWVLIYGFGAAFTAFAIGYSSAGEEDWSTASIPRLALVIALWPIPFLIVLGEMLGAGRRK